MASAITTLAFEGAGAGRGDGWGDVKLRMHDDESRVRMIHGRVTLTPANKKKSVGSAARFVAAAGRPTQPPTDTRLKS